jgi:hypothetical protein
MVSEYQQYLRARSKSGDPGKDICIYNTSFQIYGAEEKLNSLGYVSLRVETNIFEEEHPKNK